MERSELEELETLYIFTPAPGDTWGLTFTRLKQLLLELDPEAFFRVEDPREEVPGGGPFMFFEAALGDDDIEGMAKREPEGVAVQNCTAGRAAEFVRWLLCSGAVPKGHIITFNTAWGAESELPDAVVPDVSESELVEVFLAHVVQTGGLD
ncbi:hypothetical protein [Streptomyces ipomoeae]|uniref:Uncharacterized protein n=1 Tax=Streptomyces ipomoeae 91-03 TaxID=698759 RepID=L1KZ85_9ACTN|nr:hypothetical protein [Streptomyces ipomoeae]EKX65947.1 hypothetical protein STRIP9103_03437 [Streptomyces ipomoeae 91-03]MDX2697002.1 hypothetical protein [Streptomyces ipomoeae]MDX2842779.1 hypothetical protein [Streptomyces ipomoeae]